MRQHALHQSQDVLHQTHTAAHPAHRSGKLDGVAAQLIGSRHQTRRLLGSRYDLFQFCEGSWQPRCQAIRQQAEGGVRFSAIPARYLRAHRRPARIGAVARQRASATRVIRTPFGHRSSLASRHPSALTFCSPVCNVWNRSCTDRGPAGGVPRGPFSPYRLILQGYPAQATDKSVRPSTAASTSRPLPAFSPLPSRSVGVLCDGTELVPEKRTA